MMAQVLWHEIERRMCEHVREEASLEAKLAFPAEVLPDQPPRVLAHRCSHEATCQLGDKTACQWASLITGSDPSM
ncbi:MAG: hypothetical protein PVJ07_06125 [Anaerolineales bacterium]|jgi:hypothetical protein